jgi:hypothetical protein
MSQGSPTLLTFPPRPVLSTLSATRRGRPSSPSSAGMALPSSTRPSSAENSPTRAMTSRSSGRATLMSLGRQNRLASPPRRQLSTPLSTAALTMPSSPSSARMALASSTRPPSAESSPMQAAGSRSSSGSSCRSMHMSPGGPARLTSPPRPGPSTLPTTARGTLLSPSSRWATNRHGKGLRPPWRTTRPFRRLPRPESHGEACSDPLRAELASRHTSESHSSSLGSVSLRGSATPGFCQGHPARPFGLLLFSVACVQRTLCELDGAAESSLVTSLFTFTQGAHGHPSDLPKWSPCSGASRICIPS